VATFVPIAGILVSVSGLPAKTTLSNDFAALGGTKFDVNKPLSSGNVTPVMNAACEQR
jgi:hypothetical protein